MTLVEHLLELRRRLVISLIAYTAGAIVGFAFFRPIFRVIEHPYCTVRVTHVLGRCSLVITSPIGGFTVALHLALIVGAVLSAPVWLYQLWAFITPGLRRSERRYTVIFVSAAVVLFGVGAFLAYTVLPKAFAVLLGIAKGLAVPLVNIDTYLSFLATLIVVFGVAFEFPLVIVMLNLAGVLSYQRLRSWRRAEIFLVTAFAAATVPSPDPLSMLALAVPMALLYEVALVIARVHDRRKERRALTHPYQALGDDETSPLRMGEA